MLGERAIDKGDWMTMSRALMDASRVALEAAKAKNVEALFGSGETINETCDSCHQRYQRQ
jgi:cytochrome c556